MLDRGPNRGRYGNFTAEDSHRGGSSVGSGGSGGNGGGQFDRGSREGSYSGGGGGNRDDRYGNYNRRGQDRAHNSQRDVKPAVPLHGMCSFKIISNLILSI